MPISDTGVGTFNALLSELMSVGVRVMACGDSQNLFDIEAYSVSIERAMFVVDLDRSSAQLVR